MKKQNPKFTKAVPAEFLAIQYQLCILPSTSTPCVLPLLLLHALLLMSMFELLALMLSTSSRCTSSSDGCIRHKQSHQS